MKKGTGARSRGNEKGVGAVECSVFKERNTAVLLVRGEFEQGEAANCGREVMKKGEKPAVLVCGSSKRQGWRDEGVA